MSKVNWINHKDIDFDHIKNILDTSIKINQLTNYGPVVLKLESYLRKNLQIDNNKCVIVVANGAIGLHALVNGINMYNNQKMQYVTQAFTFPSAAQGPLEDAIIVDIDDDMGLDLNELSDKVFDGIVVTNLFGHVVDIDKYVKWTTAHNKILLFDNATVPLTYYHGKNSLNYGDGCIISLHHTKPLGYGEGGVIIADIKYEKMIRQCINFGFNLIDGKVNWNKFGLNGKMSEISASFILDYLSRNFSQIKDKHIKLYSYFLENAKNIKDITVFPNYSDDTPFVSCIPVMFNKEITVDHIHQIELNNITSRKYYTPLNLLPKSSACFNNILCFPLHIDINKKVIDRYLNIIKSICD